MLLPEHLSTSSLPGLFSPALPTTRLLQYTPYGWCIWSCPVTVSSSSFPLSASVHRQATSRRHIASCGLCAPCRWCSVDKVGPWTATKSTLVKSLLKALSKELWKRVRGLYIYIYIGTRLARNILDSAEGRSCTRGEETIGFNFLASDTLASFILGHILVIGVAQIARTGRVGESKLLLFRSNSPNHERWKGR